ncbi:hypothetical protein QCA50_007190 [Cerrena zonata]|uniref:VHS-domain-containing protein n=1 Tax=Cerrena zonata TaxID=2478898 RepID=A0AAW0G7L5_9APHY
MFPSATSGWLSDSSPLRILITRATYPSQPEPNYALNLEVADYIKEKKGNTPREAAMSIAQLVNHRNPHVAILALALLDTLVQSCGYPFHLQIATKEFLNELVRRFPERPPPFPGPVMSRILELIHTWKEGICQDSRFKDDFGNIRDMHRLLTFKGYRFREMPRQTSLPPAANLKSAEELENEDREAQSAKLQELIRRGTPRDLAQAQELMKSLAGANPDAKPDYRSQALNELNKLEQKVILLNEMLDNVDVARGERFAQGDVYDQVASILKGARPKIQGWISNAETDDPESLDTFLQINDSINTVLNRYEAFKKGDYSVATNPIPAELGAGPSKQNDLSLIDFDDSTPSNGSGPSAGGSNINELEDLFGSSAPVPGITQSPPVPVGMSGMQFGMGSSPSPAVQYPTSMPFNVAGVAPGLGSMNMMGSPSVNLASRPTTGSPQPGPATPMQGSIRLPGTPQVHPQSGPRMSSPAPNYFSNSPPQQQQQQQHPPSYFHQPQQQLMQSQQPQQPQQQQAQPGQTQGKDPFADLVGLF